MPGMTALSLEVAAHKKAALFELKVDGTRTTFDGTNIMSDRKIVRNERYPHIVDELLGMGIACRGEIALEGGNILQLNKKVNWHKAKYYIFDMYEVDGQSTNGLNILERRAIIDEVVRDRAKQHVTAPLRFASFKEGWDYVEANEAEGIVLKELYGECWKAKRLVEEKLPIASHLPGKSKGSFILNRNGIPCKVSGTSAKFLNAYEILKASGEQAYAEIEYCFLTDDGIPYQPRLRRLGTLDMLATT